PWRIPATRRPPPEGTSRPCGASALSGQVRHALSPSPDGPADGRCARHDRQLVLSVACRGAERMFVIQGLEQGWVTPRMAGRVDHDPFVAPERMQDDTV